MSPMYNLYNNHKAILLSSHVTVMPNKNIDTYKQNSHLFHNVPIHSFFYMEQLQASTAVLQI